MAPATLQQDDSHQRLLDSLDIANRRRPFKNPNWKPNQRRNKNVKQIIGEASRREASALATQHNSGTTTPRPAANIDSAFGSSIPLPTPTAANGSGNPNIAQAASSLSQLVLERKFQASNAGNAVPSAPAVTYTNIESAPSLHPARQKPYCDITGLPARYTDPKTRLRYHNQEIFGLARTLPQGVAEKYLETRAAHTVLK